MKKIVIATSNKHKVSEISVKIQPFFDEILSLADFPDIGEIVEDGNTIEENSFKKSMASYNHAKIASVADDTILEVDALNGDPGLFTARYAGDNASYDDNISKLLTKLKDVDDKFRTARFRMDPDYATSTYISEQDGFIDYNSGYFAKSPAALQRDHEPQQSFLAPLHREGGRRCLSSHPAHP